MNGLLLWLRYLGGVISHDRCSRMRSMEKRRTKKRRKKRKRAVERHYRANNTITVDDTPIQDRCCGPQHPSIILRGHLRHPALPHVHPRKRQGQALCCTQIPLHLSLLLVARLEWCGSGLRGLKCGQGLPTDKCSRFLLHLPSWFSFYWHVHIPYCATQGDTVVQVLTDTVYRMSR